MKDVDNRQLGRQGERIAREYITNILGYRVIESNYYASHKEIDIIASDGEYIVFIEVKCRTKGVREPKHRAGKAVGYKKRSNIIIAANTFISEHYSDACVAGKQPRIDVIEVYVPPIDRRYSDSDNLKLCACEINYIRNAFYSNCKTY